MCFRRASRDVLTEARVVSFDSSFAQFPDFINESETPIWHDLQSESE